MWRNEITAMEEKNKEMVAIFKMEKKRGWVWNIHLNFVFNTFYFLKLF